MIGYILAAGLGTRLRPLTEHIPKALVPVCGVALLKHIHSFFSSHGITRIGANAHYRADDLRAFGARESLAMEFFHEHDRIRGTGGALYFARDFLGSDSSFCTANVDILSTANLGRLGDVFFDDGCACALVAAPAESGRGTIAFDPDSGQYRGAVADGGVSEGASTADFVGLALYRREFLDILTQEDFSIVPVWQRAQASGLVVRVLVQQGLYWRDVGTPRSLGQAHFDVFDGLCRFDIAENIYVDWQEKKAYPSGLASEARQGLGPYVWSDSADISPSASITRSVVLQGARAGESEHVAEMILTPWGGIGFE